jgi:acetyltransferase-like isoleucine patch superfamily enzyme
MQDLLILGIGAHGPEMAEIVERVNAVTPTWNLLGYVSPDGSRVGEVVHGYPVLGALEALEARPEARVLPVGPFFGCPEGVRPRLASLVDPTAFVSRSARIGAGCTVYPHCYIGANARLEDFVFCLAGCVINHDDVLGERTVLASGVTLAGYVQVAADCYLGQRCTVREYLRIGAGSKIGMGAVVVKDVEAGSVMVGNPARLLRRVDEARG